MHSLIRTQLVFWTFLVPRAWDRISLIEKFSWLFFVTNTIAILTVFEVIALKH